MKQKELLKNTGQGIRMLIKRAVVEEKQQLNDLDGWNKEGLRKIEEFNQRLKKLDRSKSSFAMIIPFVRQKKKQKLLQDIAGVRDEKAKISREIQIMRKGAKESIDRIKKLNIIDQRCAKAISLGNSVFYNDKELNEMYQLAEKVTFNKNSILSDKTDSALSLSKEYLHLVYNIFQQSKNNGYEKSTPTVITNRVEGPEEALLAQAREHKIYLPVDYNELRSQINRGAKPVYNRQGKITDAYITLDQDLSLFQDSLPLSYRFNKKPLSFPPVAFNAAGQNIHSMFSRDTWDKIRKTNYRSTNHRCLMCGRKRGVFLDNVLDKDNKRHSPVDCHEIWKWDNKDNITGIQKLSRLIVVCVDCHMMFHEGFAIHKANEVGVDESEVREYLEKRRLLATEMTKEELDAMLDNDAQLYKEMGSVDNWIVDLTNLSEQSYMNFTPELIESNPAGVTPDKIAGIDFETEDGVYYETVDAEEVYRNFVERNVKAISAINFG